MSEHIHQTIADLKAQRAQLDTAIAALERLVGLPFESPNGAHAVAPARPRRERRAGSRERPTEPDGDRMAKVLKYVTDHGPIGGAYVAKGLKLSVYKAATDLRQLAAKGLVHVTGEGRGQRWHLGAKGASRSPAKEAVC